MIVVGLAQTAVWALWTLASVMVLPLIIQGGISRCRSTGVTTLEDCAPGSSWAALIWLMFLVVGVLWAWWRLVPRRMATHGASVGMGVAGLGLTDLRDEGSPVSRLQALWRALLAGALTTLWLPAFGVFLLWSLAPLREDNPVELPSWVPVAAVAVILVLQVLPTAWALVDKRGQTLYDKWSSTLSVARPGPLEPWSMAALCCALAATMFLAVAPVAVVLGHVGAARARRRPGYRRAGTARAALAIGYPCLAVLVVIVGLLILLPPPA